MRHSQIILQCQLTYLGMQGHKVNGMFLPNGTTKDIGGILKQLLLPFADLVGMQLKRFCCGSGFGTKTAARLNR
jgi:hypothetical protein